MRIIGIDPGTQRCGFAVIETIGNKTYVQDIGVYNLLGSGPRPALGVRLEKLHSKLSELFGKWNPNIIGLEKAVTFKNVSSALKLSEARGVVRLAAHQRLSEAEKRIFEMSPTAVKKEASGWGASSKEGILKVLSYRFVGLNEATVQENFSYDAFDALAIAWTAWIQSKTQSRTLTYGLEHRS